MAPAKSGETRANGVHSGGKKREREKTVDASSKKRSLKDENPITWFAALTTYLGYSILIMFGHLRDFVGNLLGISRYLATVPPKGYAPLFKSWENFYQRRLFHRIQDCWDRPICSAPGAHIEVVERGSKDGMRSMYLTDKTKNLLNLGSYNYLGFADDWDVSCKKEVITCLDNFYVSCSSARQDLGTTTLHKELEEEIAKFVGKPAAIVFGMGYNTNATVIPAIMGKGTLILSDSLNHTSIVNGSRASGARIRVFRHNDVADLEDVLREEIIRGHPRTHRPWRKILIMVEGIYSMEGECCDLKSIVEIKKKYKAYLYVDEAHSIGALGKTGRGICEQAGVDPSDVDVLMGTFTKSFSGMGGYIAGSEELIRVLRATTGASAYTNSMSPVVCKQVLQALRVIKGEDGTNIGKNKLQAVKDNSNYFREKLMDLGLEVFGDRDSPVIPIMLYNPSKIAAFSRECFNRGLAVVVVGFPATPLVLSRARICVSAGHTREDLDFALKQIDEIADLLKLKYRLSTFG